MIDMRDVLSVLFPGVAVLFAVGSLMISLASHRSARLQHFRGPELHVHFEEDEEGFGDLLVLSNVGDAALDMDVSVYVDPRDDDRYPDGGTQRIWIFRRRLYPGQPHKWSHMFPAILAEMGYRQDCTYVVRFVGHFWPSVSGKRFRRKHEQSYLVTMGQVKRLYVEQTDSDWFYADQHPKVDLAREGIPVGLSKEDQHRGAAA